MLSHYSALNIESLIEKIDQYGFCIMDHFISDSITLTLAGELSTLNDSARMHAAGTGRDFGTINKRLRGDSIYWLNENVASLAQQTYFTQMEALRLLLNQHFYLGLFALESHLAIYPTGTEYKKHLDQFETKNDKQQPQRQISCILYLNQDWIDNDGGHLRLYLNQKNNAVIDPSIFKNLQLEDIQLDISPIGGRLVIFLSDTFYHAVLPASRDRMSLTGWFLTR
ncbi:hypothetical protein GALL_252380 [mine drainage metagenome]|uniref:Fe2OG dioxygenase domain-containing protein n=1 Tax=mine drainage metagenome TaxID=410659 RepID=A0A1J5RL11_9ZZZZ